MEINKKELKNILEEQRKEYQRYLKIERKEYQRYLKVAVENIESRVSLIAEQYADIKKTLDSHTEMINSMKADIEIIKTDIEFVKNYLKKKADLEEMVGLEKRVVLLERRLNTKLTT